MGRKIFVSYKYADTDVRQFSDLYSIYREEDTARSYVTLLQEYLKDYTDHLNKGEPDGLDLSYLSDATIEDKLFDRIYDSTVTIVLLSPNMKDTYRRQKDQWIPREISYSLREQSRRNSKGKTITSGTNAMLAIVLPDRAGSYSYFWNRCTLCTQGCILYNTSWLFEILRKNTFNLRHPDTNRCDSKGSTIYHGDSSYITYVTWDDFINDPNQYIDKACSIQENKNAYDIVIQL